MLRARQIGNQLIRMPSVLFPTYDVGNDAFVGHARSIGPIDARVGDAGSRVTPASIVREAGYSASATETMRPLRPVLNSTVPACFAKIVWSRPMPVPSPG